MARRGRKPILSKELTDILDHLTRLRGNNGQESLVVGIEFISVFLVVDGEDTPQFGFDEERDAQERVH